jgi:hypothetical protein
MSGKAELSPGRYRLTLREERRCGGGACSVRGCLRRSCDARSSVPCAWGECGRRDTSRSMGCAGTVHALSGTVLCNADVSFHSLLRPRTIPGKAYRRHDAGCGDAASGGRRRAGRARAYCRESAPVADAARRAVRDLRRSHQARTRQRPHETPRAKCVVMVQVRASSETSRSTASSPGAPYHQA